MVSLVFGDVDPHNDLKSVYNSLRTEEQDVCYSKLWNFYCKLKCGMKVGLCIEKQCYCLFVVNASKTKVDVHALDEPMMYSSRPTTRHHIAHFCPNLDIARKCIRTCMKKGKPAFCGKDHVCYCGHKYKSIDHTSGENLEDTYIQFRDMYEKYFGNRNTEE
ncbi:unnamed protein product [Parnassius apollo]|uniref:(apollo) hypothetical protein n=1 Tax=Parnassius apollo TaxID=110799 RepID=A0A8S3WMH0_PARAO|nr:unnamed protein product [Parnassius apollo]